MSATTYEWLGEPQASASVKKVDGVEVARNLMPGFMGWSNIDQEGVEVVSAAHIAVHEASGLTIGAQGFPVAEPGTQVQISYEFRSTSPGPGREDGQAYALNTFSGFEVRNGRGVILPPDGEWHWTSSTQTVEDLEWGFLIRFDRGASPSFEVRNVFAWAVPSGDRPDFFNGDTPDHSISAFKVWLDGEWRLVPTLVCKGGQFHHASIKKYTGGAYHQAPMKQHANEGYL